MTISDQPTTPEPESPDTLCRCGGRPSSCSVIRVRYRVDVQSVSGRWDNVEIRDDEAIARRYEAEWRSWLNENRKTWKDIRIVKETTTAEVLQNSQADTRGNKQTKN